MFIEKIQQSKLKPEFNILCQRLLRIPNTDRTPFGMTWCVVKPGQNTDLFAHHDEEVFLILEGCGHMEIADKKKNVSSGNLIHIPQFKLHKITNTSSRRDLVFLSIHTFFSTLPKLHSKQLIVSPPITPNGPVHLGHMAGPYIAADVIQRYMSLRGCKSLHITGSDDFQTYVALTASSCKENITQTLSRYKNLILATFYKMNIKSTVFDSSYANTEHTNKAISYYQFLIEQKIVKKEKTLNPYCSSCKQYLFEGYIQGICPTCNDSITGQCCEKCGKFNKLDEIINAKCTVCQNHATLRSVELYMFPVERYRQHIEGFLHNVHMGSNLKKIAKKLLEGKLCEFPIALPINWGIKVSNKNDKHCLHPWFEMVARLTFDKLTQYEKTYFFGFDNSYYYCILMPALLIALEQKESLPDNIVMNEYYLLESKKFSTSRNHAIWAGDLVDKVPSDIIRWYLTMTRPENYQTCFTNNDFINFLDGFGKKQFEPWIKTLNLQIVRLNFCIPQVKISEFTSNQQEFLKYLNFVIIDMERNYNIKSLSLSNISHMAIEFTRRAYGFLLSEISNDILLSDEEVNSIIIGLTSLKVFAIVMNPIIPNLSREILKKLGIKNPTWKEEAILLTPESKLSNLETNLFSKAFEAVSHQQLNKI